MSVYNKIQYKDELVYILLHVDDLMICGHAEAIEKIAEMLSKHFKVKDLGEKSVCILEFKLPGTVMVISCSLKPIRFNRLSTSLVYSRCQWMCYHIDYLSIPGDEKLFESNEQYRKAGGGIALHSYYDKTSYSCCGIHSLS